MADNRENLEQALQQVERIQTQLSELKAKIQSLLGKETEFTPPDWLQDRLRVWKKILDKGGVVTRDKLYEIVDDEGYDRRGLGGFFAGPDSSLVEVGNDKIGIRPWAADEVK